MAVEKEKSPQKERPESRQEIKNEPLDESSQLASDNEEDELQVDASELVDESLKITSGEGEEDREQQRSTR